MVLEDFATQDEVRQLRERAQAIMDARLYNDAAKEEDAAIFSTVNQVGHVVVRARGPSDALGRRITASEACPTSQWLRT